MEKDKLPKRQSLWFWVIGFFAFIWIILRTGTNPKRLTYPCQQAAFPIASSWLIALLAFLGGSILLRKYAQYSGYAVVIIGITWLVITINGNISAGEKSLDPLPVWTVDNPVSEIFVMENIPLTSGSLAAADTTVPDGHLSDPALDLVLAMMNVQGIELFKNDTNPHGIVGSDDVVIIKGNFQWTSRNTTSTDRIKGIIWQILRHPDGFTGEILICDNTQNIGTGINHGDNNSEDTQQSIVDVVNTFVAKGYPVYYLDWNYIWNDVASEYSDGDYTDGYIYEQQTKITYPKFQTPSGNYYLSLSHGIWDSTSAVYDSLRLCIIDMPVLKAHSLAGATIAVKNWIGVLTTAYANSRYGGWNAMHDQYFFGSYALTAKVMAVTYPRLTILDAAWTSRQDPNILNVQRTDMLLASTDPVAVSWYAAKYILTPIATRPWNTDPDLLTSDYHINLTAWNNYLQSAGFSCTMDSSEISVFDRNILTNIGDSESVISPSSGFVLYQNYPNPFNPTTKISFTIPQTVIASGAQQSNEITSVTSFLHNDRLKVVLKVYDILGNEITTLVNEQKPAGSYEIEFDGKNLSSGVYFYKMSVGNFSESKKFILMK